MKCKLECRYQVCNSEVWNIIGRLKGHFWPMIRGHKHELRASTPNWVLGAHHSSKSRHEAELQMYVNSCIFNSYTFMYCIVSYKNLNSKIIYI